MVAFITLYLRARSTLNTSESNASAPRAEASPTLIDPADPNHEIEHFADEKTWVIGPNSKLGINHIWGIKVDGDRVGRPSKKFGIQQYMQMRDWLASMDIALPHPQQHLGARLFAHNVNWRTITQFCSALLHLWRAKDLEMFNHPDDDWKHPAQYRSVNCTRHWDRNFERYIAWLADRSGPGPGSDSFESIPAENRFYDILAHPLVNQMCYRAKRLLKSLQWNEPQDAIESCIVEAAFLFFLRAKGKYNAAFLDKLWDIMASESSIVYCDSKLPGHHLSFAEGCELRGQTPRVSTMMEDKGVSVFFDYGKSLRRYKDVIRHMAVAPSADMSDYANSWKEINKLVGGLPARIPRAIRRGA